jgi:hypothetical protein
MSNSKDQLKHAYKLIKRDKTDEARAIIRPILDAEPDNAQAWWLLAHTVDDPKEVRAALNKMLALDPRNTNAPKARELLSMLDQQFPTPSIFGEEEDSFSPFPASEAPTSANVFATDFESDFPSDDFESLGEQMFPGFEEPASSEKPEPAGVSFDIPKSKPEEDSDIVKLFQFEGAEDLDDEAKAALEEKAARRAGGRGRRLFRVVLLLLLVSAIAVGAAYVLLSGGESKKKDPGVLAAVQVQSDNVSQAISTAENELGAVELGSEKHVVVAQGALGNTLFVEFCSQPAPNMPNLIAQAMQIAVQRAPQLGEDLAAVGVSVNLCSSTPHDTLYRASVPVKDAVRFLNGEFGEGETGLAGFQATWKVS